MSHYSKILITFLLSIALCGCGAGLPLMDYRNPGRLEFNHFVRAIATHVRCELRQAVMQEFGPALLNPDPNLENRRLLRKWAAKIALTLRGIDKSTVNPTIFAFNDIMTSTLGASVQLQASSTREMTMTYYIPFERLIKDHLEIGRAALERCSLNNQIEPISGSLGIHQTIEAAAMTWDTFYPTSNDLKSGDPFDTITHNVTFQVDFTGGISPAWKLINVTVNPSSTLFSTSRQQYDQLIITMGPAVVDNGKLDKSGLNALNEAFFVERIKSAVNPLR